MKSEIQGGDITGSVSAFDLKSKRAAVLAVMKEIRLKSIPCRFKDPPWLKRLDSSERSGVIDELNESFKVVIKCVYQNNREYLRTLNYDQLEEIEAPLIEARRIIFSFIDLKQFDTDHLADLKKQCDEFEQSYLPVLQQHEILSRKGRTLRGVISVFLGIIASVILMGLLLALCLLIEEYVIIPYYE